jgi:pyruvate/2-oxoacid:ferredoxin oxidoreductase alpha subunit
VHFTLSHGDTKHISAASRFNSTNAMKWHGEAFELAEKFQTPIFVLTDLDLGMNNWMSDPFEYPTKPINRGKVMTQLTLKKLASSSATETSTEMVFLPHIAWHGSSASSLLHPWLWSQRKSWLH